MDADPTREAVVEAVARALYRMHDRTGHPWEARASPHKVRYLDDAKAALSALCELGGGREALALASRAIDISAGHKPGLLAELLAPGSEIAWGQLQKGAALLRAIGGGA